MVQTNKILTVSYGTFSCTLEGFDESFETMKAIAEYFRDLAADDRYFGAEPPTPDAEMLARIAEREIARRVEAHAGEDGIVLRPSLAGATPVASAPEPAAEMVEEAAEDATDYAAAVSMPVDAPELADDDAGDEPEQAEPEEASDESADDAYAQALDDVLDMDVKAAAETEDDLEASAADLADIAMSDAEDRTAVEEEAEVASAPEPEVMQDDEDENSIAAKLRRIRNVVSAPEASESFAEDEYSEDQHVEEMSEDNASEDDTSDDILGNIMETLGAGESDDALSVEAAADETMDEAVQDVDADEAEDVAPEAEAGASANEPVLEDEAADAVSEDLPEVQEPETEAAKPKVAPRRPVRVVKVKRRSIDKAVADGTLVEDASDEPAQADPTGSLSIDEEADLQRELAQVEAELEHPPAEGETAEAAKRAVRAVARRDQLESFGEDDSDVSRLMAETDEQLKEPEGKNRRNAIAHLRAAVAATRADRTEGRDASTASDPRDAYRDDLAQAVRPRRGMAENARSDAPKVAPLKLVAEQRVDIEDQAEQAEMQRAAAQAVRPRRVSLRDEEDADEVPGGFAAFAEERGATRLPDLLEAAASYMSFVEGRKKFSRPQLMNKVRQVEELDSSREDRLRSFGQLLREGKIEKVEGGRFAASESIGFKPARAAG